MNSADPAAETTSSWLLPVSIASIWVVVAFVSLATKCLLTDVKCSRWGPEHGANFGKPLSTSVLHLFLVGSSLALITALKDILIFRRRPRLLDKTTLVNKLKICSAVGCTFGLKSVVGHWALRLTPTAMFELFHGLNIVFIALSAWVVVGEKPNGFKEVLALIGVVVGSAIAASESFFVRGDNSIGLDAFLLNLSNGILSGAVVATLRWATLRMDGADMSIAELTCLKLLIGAMIVFPIAVGFEGATMFTLNSIQQYWMLISSAVIFIYHLNLSLICYLAPALVVGVVEALKPLPAFVIVALVQKMPQTSLMFWVGTFITLVSAVSFKLFRTLSRESLQRSSSRQLLLATRMPDYHHHELEGRLKESTPLL